MSTCFPGHRRVAHLEEALCPAGLLGSWGLGETQSGKWTSTIQRSGLQRVAESATKAHNSWVSLQVTTGVCHVSKGSPRSVSRGGVGHWISYQHPQTHPPGPRHAGGSRQPGPSTLRPSLLRPPSPSPSPLELGLGHPEHGSSRHRRGVGRRRGNRGYARRAEGPRSEFADSRWGSARCRPPASLPCSGPTAGASTQRTAARPWPPSHPAPRTHAQPLPRPRAAAASGRTRGLRDPEACQHGAGMGPPSSCSPGLPAPGPPHSLQSGTSASSSARPVPCGTSLPPVAALESRLSGKAEQAEGRSLLT